MRKVLIVGAGQSGLHLAHRLLDEDGYDVTMITSKTSTEIRTGPVAVTQYTLPQALDLERKAGLDFWSAQAPHIHGVELNLVPPEGASSMSITGRFPSGYGVSVDRRVKMADWFEYFEDRGGRVVVHGVTLDDLDFFTRMFDLVVVAVGGGELGALFDTDPTRDGGAHPRVAAEAYLHGVAPHPKGDGIADSISISGAGEVTLVPILTSEGPAYSLCLLDEPGGAMDPTAVLDGRGVTPTHVLDWIKTTVAARLPELYERIRGAELVDQRSTMVGRIQPQVRRPVATLPSGGKVLGIADAVVTTDPISAQGWNNSSHCAQWYLDAILAQGDRPFTEDSLESMFTKFWDEFGAYSATLSQLSHSFWSADIPPHMAEVLQAALSYPEVADRWIAGFDDPTDYRDWLFDPDSARSYLAEVAQRHNTI